MSARVTLSQAQGSTGGVLGCRTARQSIDLAELYGVSKACPMTPRRGSRQSYRLLGSCRRGSDRGGPALAGKVAECMLRARGRYSLTRLIRLRIEKNVRLMVAKLE